VRILGGRILGVRRAQGLDASAHTTGVSGCGQSAQPGGRPFCDASPMRHRRVVLQACGAHLLTRCVTLIAFAIAGRHKPGGLSYLVSRWDAGYYRQIALHGYPRTLPLGPHGILPNRAAFFPLFPWTVRPFLAVGLPFWLGALIVVTASSTAAAALIALVTRRYASDRVAVLTAVCWSVYPLSAVLSASYAEALVTLLAAGCLLALLDERWLAAGTLALLAGATRPSGAVLVLACAVSAALAIHRSRDWRSLLSVGLAPLGVLGSWALIGWRAGRADAWFATEAGGWKAHFDGGLDTARSVTHELFGAQRLGYAPIQGAFVLGALALLILAGRRRPPAPVLTYLIAGFAMAVGTSNVHTSIPRFLLPVFPLLTPVAQLLDRFGTKLVAVFVPSALLASIAIGIWYFTAAPFAP
jgi:hypothetical protein